MKHFNYDFYKEFDSDSIEPFLNQHFVVGKDREDIRIRLEAFIKSRDKYIEIYGSNQFIEEPFYVEYLSKINPIRYRLPPFIFIERPRKMNFDFIVLLKFITTSFCSKYLIEYSNIEINYLKKPLPEIKIILNFGNDSISKTLSELSEFQIENLTFIYLSEIWDQEVLKFEDDSEIVSIESDRIKKIALYNEAVEQLNKQLKYRNEKWDLECNLKNLFSIIS